MDSGIYAIINNKNQKVYIGSTVCFQKRWGSHCNALRHGTHDNPHLQLAWNKYGELAFEFGVLEYSDNLEELHLAEQFWMDIYRLEGKELYNCGASARNAMLGRHHTEESRSKMSAGRRGEDNHMWGKVHTEETRTKMSMSKTGQRPTEETRKKLSAAKSGKSHPMWGKQHSEETCTKISQAVARPYPAFIHQETGEVIPAGVNLSALCRERNLTRPNMRSVILGRYTQHKGWELKEQMEQL